MPASLLHNFVLLAASRVQNPIIVAAVITIRWVERLPPQYDIKADGQKKNIESYINASTTGYNSSYSVREVSKSGIGIYPRDADVCPWGKARGENS